MRLPFCANTKFSVVVAVIALLGTAAQAVVAEPSGACSYIERQFATAASGPFFLASYPTVAQGPLHASAFLYDNAVATIALIGCGKVDLARRVGDAILIALDRDRFWRDGRLRNAYLAGPVDRQGSIKLGGWWDNAQQRWVEDRYQVGSDNGNMAWAMLALLALDNVSDDPKYRSGALRIGNWITTWRDNRGAGGFTGGTFAHEPAPVIVRWKSTEHNTDLAAAFSHLAQATGETRWRELSKSATRFVVAMWDSTRQCFATGTGDDGVTINPIVVLDAQVWPLLAQPGAAQHYVAAISTAQKQLRDGDGFAYSEVRDGIWTEGTAQMLLLMELLGRKADAALLRAAIERQRAPDGGYYASSASRLPTGFMLATDPSQPRLYYRLPHLGAAAWVALAERRFNPFTATSALPVANDF
jgi:hypothetical protein